MKTKDTFKKAIDTLPVESCPDGIWVKIEQHLRNEDQLQVVVNELPMHECPDGVWPALSDMLDKKSVPKILSLWVASGIAASVAFTLLCVFYLVGPEKSSLSFYEEESSQTLVIE